MNEEKRFVYMIPINEGYYMASSERVGELKGCSQVLNESQVLDFGHHYNESARLYEIIERKVETKKVIV